MAALSTSRIMLTVLAALLPGIATLLYYFGPGYLPRLAFGIGLGLAIEALLLTLQQRPVLPTLRDASTPVTCTLLTLALPPEVSYGALALGVVAAVGVAKHVYGGLGANPFNPAIVGYAVVLVSFPAQLARWPVPTDGLTAATALTTLRHREGETVTELWTRADGFGALGGYGWEWINLAFLAGGLALMIMRIAAWRIPASLLGTLALLALFGYDNGSSDSLGSPLFHWFSGGTCLAACFFATDPVTHPVTARGQLLFGALIAAIAFAVRSIGNYPDGLAFGILLANGVSPYLDRVLVVEDGRHA